MLKDQSSSALAWITALQIFLLFMFGPAHYGSIFSVHAELVPRVLNAGTGSRLRTGCRWAISSRYGKGDTVVFD
ncbi:hypothetical protein EYZ11_003817 [Aspergillus tanneri]|uniref:Uncharacterized protein n=1 Tax=Aspergillus tanneri TaxID=1220188 RepID=A0A4S3JT13_9EURO|nr:hypothetical protein EYZ11_003817 [Aspergillus tanneri]